MGAHEVSASLTAFSLRRRCRSAAVTDEVESRKLHQVFYPFIPSDFLTKITSPCNKGRPEGFCKPRSLHPGEVDSALPKTEGVNRKLLQTLTARCGHRALFYIYIPLNLSQTPQSRTSRDSSPAMGAHEVFTNLIIVQNFDRFFQIKHIYPVEPVILLLISGYFSYFAILPDIFRYVDYDDFNPYTTYLLLRKKHRRAFDSTVRCFYLVLLIHSAALACHCCGRSSVCLRVGLVGNK